MGIIMFIRVISCAVFFLSVIFLHLDVTNAQVAQAEFGSVGMTTVLPMVFHASVSVFAGVMWWRAFEADRRPVRAQTVSAAHTAVP